MDAENDSLISEFAEFGGAVQADCICIVYLRVPVCVVDGGGASSTPQLESTPVSSFDCEKDTTVLST